LSHPPRQWRAMFLQKRPDHDGSRRAPSLHDELRSKAAQMTKSLGTRFRRFSRGPEKPGGR
jgi:hypothetical protein